MERVEAIVPLIEWNPTYSVGVPTFDRQHQKLFDLINQLHEAMARGEGRQYIGSIVKGLMEYTKAHFSEEEAALQKAGYRELASHSTQHRVFEEKVASFAKDLEGGSLLSIDVKSFLNDWLVNHIMKVDKGYTALMASAAMR